MRLFLVCAAAAILIGCGGKFADVAKYAGNFGEKAPSEAQMIEALKTALTDGAADAAAKLSQSGGYDKSALYRIPLPPEADTIVKNAKLISGGERLIDDTITRINAAAETAAKEAAPIFAKAIADMTITDAIGILKGGDSAATDYLRRQTSGALKAAFAPKLDAALAKPIVAGVSAQTAWNTLTSGYNKAANSIAGKLAKLEPVKTSINDYALDKALAALFNEAAIAEAKVRADPLSSGKAIVQKVFEYAKNTLNK
ncbi:MAG: DUF4197 domain-containing protein [Helicobacteraceae bacterium]|jgi:hypothetical protein|nr:DUF4197 domain-containing protein [Helicobacteraceae bacterium]